MKKVFKKVICFALILASLQMLMLTNICLADTKTAFDDNTLGFGGLLFSICGKTYPITDDQISSQTANEILKSAFGDTPFASSTVLNCHLVKYLATKTEVMESRQMRFLDFGLIDNKYKSSYRIINNAKKLYSEDGFLNPSKPLCYSFLINQLALYEEEIISKNSIEVVNGELKQAVLDGRNYKLYIATEQGMQTIKFKSTNIPFIYKSGKCEPYVKLKSGDELTIYIANKEVLYIKSGIFYKDMLRNINSIKLICADIYYLDDDVIIVKNAKTYQNGEYVESEQPYAEYTLCPTATIEHNGSAIDADTVNLKMLDKSAYLVCNDENNVKYIYITE